ncbi:MnmC family methyltransferase [Geitlerinema sp. PCC 9228]|uniref:tRNA (5-methylaminomethyl-2-thiouridine)(34)-methyltransferase MnmD n=1 Tax=Geitlerinema sp. PCC 9228 TaxID=111611 RepID=UPI0008F9D8EC|nr:MnmC family methyltransferase [Geitlerinema sp. PCC 9228]
MTTNQPFFLEETADGSFTFISSEFQEAFHSHYGAKREAEEKFVKTTRLSEQAQRNSLRLLDVCYGLGYNTAAALATIWQHNPHCRIEWIGLERDLAVVRASCHHHLLDWWGSAIVKLLEAIAQRQQVQTPQFQGQLLLADARQTIQQAIQQEFLADAIFLDPFSPTKCPQLWTVEFLGQVAQCLHPQGYLATYSCAAAVRTAFLENQLHIGATTPVGRKTPGTLARWENSDLPLLSQAEREHLQTRAAVPYRDPTLSADAATIVQRRQREQQWCGLEPTSQWKKRWRDW